MTPMFVDSLPCWIIGSDPRLDSSIKRIVRHSALSHKVPEPFIGVVAITLFAEACSIVEVEIQDDLRRLRKRKEEPVAS